MCLSRRLHGRRGLKLFYRDPVEQENRRRLHGRRGLKSTATAASGRGLASPPSRAAWIEILHLLGNDIPEEVAAFTGGVD